MTDQPEHFEEGEEAPPRGVRAAVIVRWALLAAVILAALFAAYRYAAPWLGQGGSGVRAALYRCPMHPQIVSDHPGESCPICHMDLELVPSDQPAPGAASAAAPPPSGPAAPGLAPITLAPARAQAIGVRTAVAERAAAADVLRVNAVVEAPEQGRAEVHARAPGFLEHIRVSQTGVKVKAGEMLAAIYSPEVYQAQQELLTMSAWSQGGAPAPGGLKPPLDVARRRLELLGVGGATVDRIVAGGRPLRTIGISSPIGGYVVRKNVVLGSYVTPEAALYEIADLSRVYVVANVYGSQLPGIRIGDVARFVPVVLGGRVFETKVDLIYPEIDLATRTTRVRFQVDNQGLALRPGQFGTLELSGAPAPAVTVPLDAVVDTGRASYVFVVEDAGRFVPRSVELGEQLGDRFVIKAGLAEGERVVSGATFLIDSESRLIASAAAPAASHGAHQGDR